MALFHQTLSDALKALKHDDPRTALAILNQHRDAELTEDYYIKTSLYAIRQYLQNYIGRIEQAIEILSKENLGAQDKELALQSIERCIHNIQEFEEGTKGLLKREGSVLE